MAKIKVNKMDDKMKGLFEETIKEAHLAHAEKIVDEAIYYGRRLFWQTIEPSPRLSGVQAPQIKEKRNVDSIDTVSYKNFGSKRQKLTKAIPRFKKKIEYIKGKGVQITISVFVSDNNSPTKRHLPWHALNDGMSYTYDKTRVVPMVGSRGSDGKYFPRTRPNSGFAPNSGSLGYMGARSPKVRFRTMRKGQTVSYPPRNFYKIIAHKIKKNILDKKKGWEYDVAVITG